MRQLSKIRKSRDDLAFETKIRQRQGRKRWGVIVAQRTKLRFDQRSLFYDRRGRRLHNYTNLGKGGEKITPTQISLPENPKYRSNVPRQKRSFAMGEKHHRKYSMHMSGDRFETPLSRKKGPVASGSLSELGSKKTDESVTTPLLRRIPSELQQYESYGAKRYCAQWRGDGAKQARDQISRSLQRKAFALMHDFACEHWDNCKVIFSRRAVFRYALQALQGGHESSRILTCYAQSLFICHGLAVDRAAHTGEVVFFNISSTIAKARKMLARDGLTSRERVALWYRNHPRSTPTSKTLEELDIGELRRRIAESLGEDLPRSSPRSAPVKG